MRFATFFFLPVVDGRQAHLLLEERSEGRGVGKVEAIGYLLHALVGGGDERHGLLRDGFEHQLLHGASRHRLDQRGEILGRQAETVGIESHPTLLHVMMVDEAHELHVGLQSAARRLVALLR